MLCSARLRLCWLRSGVESCLWKTHTGKCCSAWSAFLSYTPASWPSGTTPSALLKGKTTVSERAQRAATAENTCKLRKQLPQFDNTHAASAHNTTQHNTTQHNTRQDNTTQHNTTQHNTTQHNTTQHNTQCSCGSVVEHCVSSTKVVGSIPREHMYWQKYV